MFRCYTNDAEFINDTCPNSESSSCTRLEYSDHTIVQEWHLVCDRNWLSKMTMSALMLGFLIGSLVLGRMADIIGRKSNYTFTLLGMLFTNTMSALTTSFLIYTMSRFMVGIFLAGNILSVVTLITELVGPSYRGVYSISLMAAFSCGIVCVSLLASHLHHWRVLSLSGKVQNQKKIIGWIIRFL